MVQYDSAEWKPAFLSQAREFLFFPCYPGRQASEFLFSTEELGPSPTESGIGTALELTRPTGKEKSLELPRAQRACVPVELSLSDRACVLVAPSLSSWFLRASPYEWNSEPCVRAR